MSLHWVQAVKLLFLKAYCYASTPHVYPANLGQGNAPTTMDGRSITTEIAVQMGNAHKLRKLSGCVVNSLSLSTSIGQPVNGTIDMSFGKEVSSTIDGSGAITQQTAQTQAGKPYTFAHGHFKVHNGSSKLALSTALLPSMFTSPETGFNLFLVTV